MGVMPERTGWRDESLSRRHREWGTPCPAVDIDFMLLEFSGRKAVALVEYKNEHAKKQYKSHPTFQALIDLGERAGLPVFACRYTTDLRHYNVIPLNRNATIVLPDRELLTETQYVTMLYDMREKEVPPDVLEKIRQRG